MLTNSTITLTRTGEKGELVTTRDRILDATLDVIRTRGLARATTKEIARSAELSEAMLYRHFQSKTHLFLAVLSERLPRFVPLSEDLPARVGTGTVEGNLELVARAALDFYGETFPLLAGVFAEPETLVAHRDGLDELSAGPHQPIQRLTDYLEAERTRGRIAPEADVASVACLLLGACLQRAFLRAFSGSSADPARDDAFAAQITRTLARNL